MYSPMCQLLEGSTTRCKPPLQTICIGFLTVFEPWTLAIWKLGWMQDQERLPGVEFHHQSEGPTMLLSFVAYVFVSVHLFANCFFTLHVYSRLFTSIVVQFAIVCQCLYLFHHLYPVLSIVYGPCVSKFLLGLPLFFPSVYRHAVHQMRVELYM